MVHDESKDVRLLSKIAKINPGTKTITINKNQIVGNKRWGRLDYLCHYCGYHIVYNDNTVVSSDKLPETDNRKNKRDQVYNRKRNKLAMQ